MQIRVTFQFPTDTEVRYLERVPRRGERVRGRGGELFVVSRVESEDGHLAACLTLVEYTRDARRLSRKMRDLAHELRERAVEARLRNRQRWRSLHR